MAGSITGMVGPKRPGPAPLPKSEKLEPVALVRATPSERAELEAWARAKKTPLATLLREAGLRAARRA